MVKWSGECVRMRLPPRATHLLSCRIGCRSGALLLAVVFTKLRSQLGLGCCLGLLNLRGALLLHLHLLQPLALLLQLLHRHSMMGGQ